MKNDPALRRLGSSGSITIDFERRRARTVLRTSASELGSAWRAVISRDELGVTHGRCATGSASENRTERTTWRPRSSSLNALLRYENRHEALSNVFDLGGASIHDANRNDRLADLLAVGSHVLNGRCADVAGNSRKTFDTRPPLAHRAIHEGIELLARSYAKIDPLATCMRLGLDALDANAQNQAVEPAIADQQVAATSEHRDRNPALPCPMKRAREHRLVFDIEKEPRPSSHTQCGARGKIDVFSDRGLGSSQWERGA